jgi:hypothetical protein
MTLPNLFKSGTLEKLKIESFEKPDRSIPKNEFVVMFNPDKFSQRQQVAYSTDDAPGKPGSKQTFQKIEPQSYEFTFHFDGTGATGVKKNVSEEIQNFMTVTSDYDGSINRPPYLKLSWGFISLKCILTSAEISYSLFRPDGAPLRASINASFTEDSSDALQNAKVKKTSSNFTHIRTVNVGDSLLTIAAGINGASSVVADLARANNLDNLRGLTTGATIIIPALKSFGL